MKVRHFFVHTTVFALALGGSLLASAQSASAPASGSQAAQSENSAKAGKKHKSAAAGEKSSAGEAAGVPAADKMFIKKAAQGGMAEVDLGTLAAQKGSDNGVKQFGQKMVDDHGKANEELKSLAQRKKGVTLPKEPDAASKAMKMKLEKMSGAQFDKAYMQHMVADHKKDVAEFKKEGSSGTDPDVKSWADEDHSNAGRSPEDGGGHCCSGRRSEISSG